MLVLSRRPGERIIIGGNIVVTLVEVRQNRKARIGIEAPADVSIHREEIQHKIDQAAHASPPPHVADAVCDQDATE